jgi:hypothetical protein
MVKSADSGGVWGNQTGSCAICGRQLDGEDIERRDIGDVHAACFNDLATAGLSVRLGRRVSRGRGRADGALRFHLASGDVLRVRHP